MIVVVASQNPVKIAAVVGAYAQMGLAPVEVFGVSVPSGVSDQPKSTLETLQGAESRAQRAREEHPAANHWIGIEGGVDDAEVGMLAFAWVVIEGGGLVGRARSGTFLLPDAIAALVRNGKELGEADDIVFGQKNSKQKQGAIGLLTGGVIDRKSLYEHAVVLALAPHVNRELYVGNETGQVVE